MTNRTSQPPAPPDGQDEPSSVWRVCKAWFGCWVGYDSTTTVDLCLSLSCLASAWLEYFTEDWGAIYRCKIVQCFLWFIWKKTWCCTAVNVWTMTCIGTFVYTGHAFNSSKNILLEQYYLARLV
jgi:hypothetical protein